MAIKVVDSNGLSYFWNKIKSLLSGKVDKELKTGSTTVYKGLSDNNLTDEMVTKIQNAGDSSFSGNYEDLAGIPETFNPATHTHESSEISDLSTITDGEIDSICVWSDVL